MMLGNNKLTCFLLSLVLMSGCKTTGSRTLDEREQKVEMAVPLEVVVAGDDRAMLAHCRTGEECTNILMKDNQDFYFNAKSELIAKLIEGKRKGLFGKILAAAIGAVIVAAGLVTIKQWKKYTFSKDISSFVSDVKSNLYDGEIPREGPPVTLSDEQSVLLQQSMTCRLRQRWQSNDSKVRGQGARLLRARLADSRTCRILPS